MSKWTMFNDDGTWKRDCSGQYTAILELDKKLSENGILHTLLELMDGWVIIGYDREGERVGDAIEHIGSYGHEQNHIEVYGFDLSEPEGNLTVEQALAYFEKAHAGGYDYPKYD